MTQQEIWVGILKFWIDQLSKTMLFYFTVTGAVVSYVLSNVDSIPYIEHGLILPIVMGLGYFAFARHCEKEGVLENMDKSLKEACLHEAKVQNAVAFLDEERRVSAHALVELNRISRGVILAVVIGLTFLYLVIIYPIILSISCALCKLGTQTS